MNSVHTGTLLKRKTVLRVLSIDPGNIESAWVNFEKVKHSARHGIQFRILGCAKEENEKIREGLVHDEFNHDILVMEQIIGRKWSGKEVTDTAFWSGRLCEASQASFALVNRSKIRWHIGQEKKTTDAIVTRKLIERFCPDIYAKFEAKEISKHQMFNDAKDAFFHKFKDDIWQAFAAGVTWYDLNIH
jgi:hypothetical protein